MTEGDRLNILQDSSYIHMSILDSLFIRNKLTADFTESFSNMHIPPWVTVDYKPKEMSIFYINCFPILY
jgi:hypothetical protein